MARGKNTTGHPLAVKAAVAALLFLALQGTIAGCRKKVEAEVQSGESGLKAGILRETADAAGKKLYAMFMPGVLFEADGGHETCWLLQEQMDSLVPFYGYVTGNLERYAEDDESYREILLMEAEERTGLEETDAANELPILPLEQGQEDTDSSLAELLRAENEAAMQIQDGLFFTPHLQQSVVDLAALQDFETLLREFYIVDSNTMAGSDQLNVESFLAKDMTVDKETQGPQILIFHTHSREGFADSVSGDSSTTVVGVGERLAQILTDTYGYQVLHHTAEYDTDRNQAYSKALPGIEQILEDNPSIQVVIDLHRDEMPEETRLVMDLDGRPTARFMFFNGLSRTKKTGNIAYLYNENLEDNLAFSFQMQKKAAEYYPGLTRKIYLKGYRYNMHLKDKYLLVELGAQNNTVEEAMNACDPLAHILDMVLSGE